jgi:tetratricopeptide (TPR) repeat protein
MINADNKTLKISSIRVFCVLKKSLHLCCTMKVTTLNSWLILLLIILSGTNGIAQKSSADSLRLLIAKETNDTSKVKLLIKLAFNADSKDSVEAECFREVYALSKKKHFLYGLAQYHYYEGIQLFKSRKYDEAIEKYKLCIEEQDSLHIIQPFNSPLSNIRAIYNFVGKQEEKFRYYTDKLAYYRKHGPIENTANCLHGIAGYYWYLGDYDKAIGYFLRAQDVYKSFDPVGYTNEKEAIGTQYLDWGNFDKAEEYLKSALNDKAAGRFYCYHHLGNLNFKRHDYKKALYNYFMAKPYSSEPEFIAMNQVMCAAVHLQFNSLDSARIYLDSANKIRKFENLVITYTDGNLEIDFYYYKYYMAVRDENHARQSLEAALQEAQSTKIVPLVLKYTDELHKYLLQRGDSLQALRYLIQGHTLQDSLNAMNTRARTATFEIEQQAKEKEIEIEQLVSQKATQRNYYLIGGALLLLIVIGVIRRLIYKRKRDKEQIQTDFKKQLAQAETKALRSQMNPHFIFNSLNSINSFVMDQKHEIASDYLIKFSKLIRLILDNSRSETISIDKELETLKLYVILESARFDNKFKCNYSIAANVDTHSIMIPPMLLQPFVENAIWHGLMQKEEEGTITVEIKKEDEEFLNISITDDGIGREKAAALKSKSATHKSHGLKVTSQRIEMMNKLNSTGAQVHIYDLKDDKGDATGTKVELIIPY